VPHVAARDNSPNSHLENGHAIHYSDRMSISCVTAAPIRHPPGEANAASRALPPPAWVAQVAAPAATWAAPPQEAQSQGARSKGPCRLATTRQATLQLQPAQQLRLGVAKNASGDTRRHATQLARRPTRLTEELINFWTFGPGRARPEIQKCPPFFHPISSQNIEKQRLKRAATGGKRKDFWIALMGPPRRAPQSKSPKRT
jgi:hypothetical protein